MSHPGEAEPLRIGPNRCPECGVEYVGGFKHLEWCTFEKRKNCTGDTAMRTSDETIRELERLNAERTQGEWNFANSNSMRRLGANGYDGNIAHGIKDRCGVPDIQIRDEDGACIAAAVNALPDMLADLREFSNIQGAEQVTAEQSAASKESRKNCDCELCNGTGFVGPDGTCCNCIRHGCRDFHTQNNPEWISRSMSGENQSPPDRTDLLKAALIEIVNYDSADCTSCPENECNCDKKNLQEIAQRALTAYKVSQMKETTICEILWAKWKSSGKPDFGIAKSAMHFAYEHLCNAVFRKELTSEINFVEAVKCIEELKELILDQTACQCQGEADCKYCSARKRAAALLRKVIRTPEDDTKATQ